MFPLHLASVCRGCGGKSSRRPYDGGLPEVFCGRDHRRLGYAPGLDASSRGVQGEAPLVLKGC